MLFAKVAKFLVQVRFLSSQSRKEKGWLSTLDCIYHCFHFLDRDTTIEALRTQKFDLEHEQVMFILCRSLRFENIAENMHL